MNLKTSLAGVLLLLPALAFGQSGDVMSASAWLSSSGQTAASGGGGCNADSETACVDWENGLAFAPGQGAPASWATAPGQKNLTAQKAAKIDAARNILELIKGIALTSATTLQGSMTASDTVRTTVEGRLQGLRQVGKPKYFSDGTIQVKVEARLREVVPGELLAPEGAPKSWGAPKGDAGAAAQVSYTGLILDARGAGVSPAMSPRILDPKGEEVYSAAYVSREFALQQGVVGYAKDPKKAVDSDRVKGNPMVIKVTGNSGTNHADIVISQAAADTLRAVGQKQNFLRECRVLVILD